MRRDLGDLTKREFDIVVIGGGIAGACVAWDATLRGLTVALLERGDFGSAASANSFKIVHGGIRYLQHFDIRRVRASVAERSVLLRIAPHLVEPIPFAVPTYPGRASGRAWLGAGLKAYDLLASGLNRRIEDPARRVPRGRILSRDEALSVLPDIELEGVTGAAVFHDGLIYNPPRLTWSFIRGAAALGACVANYVEVTGLERDGGLVKGTKAVDRETGEELRVSGRVVVNATGGWAHGLLADLAPGTPPTFSRDACFVVRRRLTGTHAVALLSKTRDPGALVSRGARHLFLVPWRDHTLVGVWHTVYRGDPDAYHVEGQEIDAFIAEVNEIGPGLELSRDDVGQTCCGLVLFGENEHGARELRYGKRSLMIDHSTLGAEGLITAVAVRFTVGRRLAERVVDRVVERLGVSSRPCATTETPLPGGDVRMDELSSEIERYGPTGLSTRAKSALARNYGGNWRQAIEPAESDPTLLETAGDTAVTGAEIVHAVREEMAVTLEDVLLRRTEIGSAGHPGREAMSRAAGLVASELGWSKDRTQREVDAVERAYPSWTL